jgi:hypothetical protein
MSIEVTTSTHDPLGVGPSEIPAIEIAVSAVML